MGDEGKAVGSLLADGFAVFAPDCGEKYAPYDSPPFTSEIIWKGKRAASCKKRV
jgi:hypothetical protein